MADSTSSTPRIIGAWVMVAIFTLFCLILLPIGLDAGNSELLLGFGSFVFWMVLMGILLSLNWIASSRDDSCVADHDCHCEALLVGVKKIKQPINTWSDLGFVAGGLIIFYLIGQDRLSGTPAPNPMRETSLFSITYGLLAIYLGPGSMFYHASIKKWGGWADNMSMVLWTTFLVVYVFARGIPLPDSLAVIIFLVIVSISGAIIWFVEGSGKYIFGGLVAVWGVLEIILLIVQATGGALMGLHRTEWGYLVGAGLSFLVAVIVWTYSKDGKPWCRPYSVAQGHAVWHILSALSAYFIFLYLRSEVLV
jgi:hypothetical protein